MEKKVAVILLAVIGLGFYVSSLAFLIGNPFTTTEGSYRYSFSDVTVEVPLGWLDNLFKLTNVKGINLTTYNEKIIIHVGNSTTTVSGKNWEHYISRIVGPLIAYLLPETVGRNVNNLAYNLALRYQWSNQLQQVIQPIVIIEKPYQIQDLVLGFVIGMFTLYVVGTENGRRTTKEWVSLLREGFSYFRLRFSRGKKVD